MNRLHVETVENKRVMTTITTL